LKPGHNEGSPRKAAFSRAGILAGIVRGQALAASALAYGMVFGVLASKARLTALEAALMSASVYSGSAQLAVLQGWSSAPLLLPVVAIILLMNARYLLYGAALRPWLGALPPHQTYPSLFFLGDGNWALAMKRYGAGELDAGFVLGSGLVMYVAWVLGTVVGHIAGSAIGEPERFGLDFMLVAFSAALAVDFWKGRELVKPALAALLTALLCDRAAPGGWTIVASGLAGATVAYLAYRETGHGH